MRSVVALPSLTTRWPAEHCCLLAQNAEPFESWKVVLAHPVQASAFVLVVYCPAGHARQRSGVATAVLDSNVPGLHGCFVLQNGWLAVSWYLPLGQSVQLGKFAVPEKVPTRQGVQSRFEVRFPAASTREPAAHEAWSTQ